MKLFILISFFELLALPIVDAEPKVNSNVKLEVFQYKSVYYAKVINTSGSSIYYEYGGDDCLSYKVEVLNGVAWEEAKWDPGPQCGNVDLPENYIPHPLPTASLWDHRYKQVELFELSFWRTNGLKARIKMTFSWDKEFKDTFTVYSNPLIISES